MYSEEHFKKAIGNLLTSTEGHDFFKDYFDANSIKTPEDLEKLFDSFKEYLKGKGKWNSDAEIAIKIFNEHSNDFISQNSGSPIFTINRTKKINDSWIQDFLTDFGKCKTEDRFAEEVLPRKYKTITENMILFGVDGKRLSEVHSKYLEYNHPLVNYTVSSTLYNSKNFSQGLPILKKAIESVASYPHYYWDSEYGIEGATWSIADILYLVSNKGFEELGLEKEKYKLLKLLFLYLSRYICMTKSNIKSIDFYSNRARIVKGYFMEFVGIFDLGVNPDIQYISDMYLAYNVAMKNNLTAIPSFMQLMWDSLKMYRHGSHIPNNSGGYQEIEDRTWMELVRDGEIRSIMLADKLFKEFTSYNLNVSKPTIEKLFEYAQSNHSDNTEKYMDKIQKRRLN